MTRRKNREAAATAAVSAPASEPAEVTKVLSQGLAENIAKVAKPATTGDTVTVGCKTPNGIILQLQEKVEVSMPVLGGGFKLVYENRPDPNQESHTLFGNRAHHGEQPKCLVVGGYAMTPGIPAEFMAKWMEQNKRLDIVTSGLIIVQPTTDRARAQAREQKGIRSGLEPLTPGDDLRMPKRRDPKTGKTVDSIETGDEQPAAAA